MDFFEHQARAHRNTGWLMILFILSVVLTIAAVYGIVAAIFLQEQNFYDPNVLLGTCAVTLVLIIVGSLYKSFALRQGGETVALLLGGRRLPSDTAEQQERRLLNVVEEMAIASGVPVPPVYVMDSEPGINAFAAGFSPSDAVVAFNRGTLEALNRDQLQGVVAHEFSHILNGDMRLNLRLIGWLHGLLMIFLTGRILFELMLRSGSRHTVRRSSSNDNKKGGDPRIAFLLLGLGLMAVGSIGLLFGRLIKSAVSRQREFLADASAVQFTRNPDGIGGALLKIEEASVLPQRNPNAEDCSHMFFSNAVSNWVGLMATHPPLPERIRRINPHLIEPEHPASPQVSESLPPDAASEVVAGFAGQTPFTGPLAGSQELVPAERGTDRHIGMADEVTMNVSQDLLSAVPRPITELARNPFSARAVTLGFLISADPEVRERQFEIVQSRLEPTFVELLRRMLRELVELQEDFRLPLIDLSLSALRQMSPAQYDAFRTTVQEVIEADGKLQVFEFVIQRMVLRHLDRIYRKRPLPKVTITRIEQAVDELGIVLGALAYAGSDDEAGLQRQFAEAVNSFHNPRLSRVPLPQGRMGLSDLDRALSTLSQSSPEIKRQMIEACRVSVEIDGWIRIREAELFRGIANALDIPVNLMLPGRVIR